STFILPPPPSPTLFPYTTLFRSPAAANISGISGTGYFRCGRHPSVSQKLCGIGAYQHPRALARREALHRIGAVLPSHHKARPIVDSQMKMGVRTQIDDILNRSAERGAIACRHDAGMLGPDHDRHLA